MDQGPRLCCGNLRRGAPGTPAAPKHSFEKIGDHREPKAEKGPSAPGAALPRGRGETFGGVDYKRHSKDELMERARDLGVRGRSKMTKAELAAAIARKQ